MPNFHNYRPLVSLSRAFLLIFLTVGGSIFSAQASEDSEDEIFNPADLIMHHIIDSHEWHLFSAGDIHVTIPLPVILYSSENGLVFFLSNKITHGDIYKGYRYEHNHIVAEDGHSFFDFSITFCHSCLVSFSGNPG